LAVRLLYAPKFNTKGGIVTDESLIREVDEEVRQDEYQKIWTRHGNKIIAVAVAAVLAVAGFEGWKYFQRTQAEQASIVYFDAAEKAEVGKLEDALAALAAVKHQGFGQLAKMREAAVLADKGDTEKAIATYDAIVADASTDPVLADLARIRQGYLLVDTKTPDELLTKLGMFDKDGNAWRHAAREIFGLAAYRVKDFAMADRYMNAIFSDPDAPQSLKQRAQVMVQLIAPELPKK
jgi:hypothetical protein